MNAKQKRLWKRVCDEILSQATNRERTTGNNTKLLLDWRDAEREELLFSLKEVVRIRDRKHDAWDKAKVAIAHAEGGQE